MNKSERSPIVLVVAKEEVLRRIRDALADTNLALLCTQSRREAIAILERLKCVVDVAIVELDLPDFDGWDLIRRITFIPEKFVRIIATTSAYPEQHFERIKGLGVDAVVPTTISPGEWRKTVEAVLKDDTPSDSEFAAAARELSSR